VPHRQPGGSAVVEAEAVGDRGGLDPGCGGPGADLRIRVGVGCRCQPDPPAALSFATTGHDQDRQEAGMEAM